MPPDMIDPLLHVAVAWIVVALYLTSLSISSIASCETATPGFKSNENYVMVLKRGFWVRAGLKQTVAAKAILPLRA